MSNIIKATTINNNHIEFVDKIIGAGGMKDVYFSPDRSYVVEFFRDRQDFQVKERLVSITGQYHASIFNQNGGNYWKNLFCWPTDVIEFNGKLGVVAPAYQKHFYFEWGSNNNDFLNIKGHEKEGKWFASASNQNRFLDLREQGDWLNYFRISILLARSVKRLHAAGLAHSDLSYKNCLVDPVGGNACIIDIDSLAVPGKYPPDVIGTPDFIAPEVVMTNHLPKENRSLPCIATDRHALAVLIYMYLLYRHPLRGDKIHDHDPQADETFSMGSKALFIEHPTDRSNCIKIANVKRSELPQHDTNKRPYKLTGPYLVPLFDRAFIEGLHNPANRPTADDWERALVKTVDLIQPCFNHNCKQKWYVFDNTTKPSCPFCGTPHRGKLPVLNLYSSRREGNFRPDNHRLMVYTNQSLFPWHINRNIFPNERLTDEQKRRVGYFVLHNGSWWLINENMPDLMIADTKTLIRIGEKVELKDDLKLLFSREDGGRLVVVQMVDSQ
ncbi:MAG: kinase [Candidatus Desantisbacteria bacterium]